jgi:hypothetical protein
MSIFFEDGNWSDDWFAIGAGTKVDPSGTVTALMPFDGHVDLFATTDEGDGTGTVMSTFFDNGNWQEGWFPIHPEVRMQPGATVTPVQPFAGHVDLFCIAINGRAVTTFFQDGAGWQNWFEFP